MVNADASWRTRIRSQDLTFFLRLTNLLEEEARLSTSFRKDVAPCPAGISPSGCAARSSETAPAERISPSGKNSSFLLLTLILNKTTSPGSRASPPSRETGALGHILFKTNRMP
ncbi:MAG: hypothetical protein J0M04_00865 [Verrucomicrobia bacterium]|nr:hypothetical protein [Verrucomicrobiota bacterium]